LISPVRTIVWPLTVILPPTTACASAGSELVSHAFATVNRPRACEVVRQDRVGLHGGRARRRAAGEVNASSTRPMRFCTSVERSMRTSSCAGRLGTGAEDEQGAEGEGLRGVRPA
jgi:hypothetical protein